ncbi:MULTISPECIES: alkyl sulfatase dimerization domain-containing protein [unclassified Novosphingobium]|uniref:alkyl/aryl-sulfatase n=1 Tax=unclassified Novosphingobium TaxID=2644732 RepID=UPI0025CD853B|nr:MULTISPECIES: alkyl sulfatase dimerization domain-containing protein [unclassified Novosphingobium]HQV02861.1 alkyl sulfatase dimerization domain-containing protein [Novosphingobium sp.]
MYRHALRLSVLALLLSGTAALAEPAQDPALQPKEASPATIKAQQAAAGTLPSEDGRDAEFARRGFVATRDDPIIRNAQGKPVWNLAAYDFVTGAAPATVNPSLWREMTNLRLHGLYQVSDGVWQVRGFDISNMTLIRSDSGWIIVDPLTNRETAAAALELANAKLGARPVIAVIYSHSHGDHYGGVRGIVAEADVKAGKVAIIAPDHFMKETASENVMAGAAMGRRATYQFGTSLTPGPKGQMGSGIGPGVAGGEITLIPPTDTILKTGDTRTIDGVNLEFQIVSGSEAPSELNVYIVPRKVFLSAEMSTCSLHNILTPRGAKVRDTHAWAGYLDEALRLYGVRSDVVISSHCWPRFGQGEVATMLASQRDNYRYLHDQSVRRMNQGQTQVEIAEGLVQPPELAGQWYNRGYYGTYSHNSKAVYQWYLGWYDGNPANLHPWPPQERARRYVEAIGGAKKVLAVARKAMAAGDYRWSSDLLNQLVFADPANKQARALLADSYEQQGYQAESGIWRNQFLSAARELRQGYEPRPIQAQGVDMISAVPTQLLLDTIATRYAPERMIAPVTINLVLTDTREDVGIEVGKSVLIARVGQPGASPNVTITGPRRAMLGLFFLKMPLAQLQAMGVKVDGDPAAVAALQAALDPISNGFNIAEP